LVKAVAAAVAAVAVVATMVGFDIFPHTRKSAPMIVTAQFEDTVGLYEGNAVSLLGMSIGKVTSIRPRDTYVEVELEINPGIDLPAEVQAVTVSTSILTDRHIEMTPPYRKGPKLRNGDLLTLRRTRTPVEFDRTLAMADKLSHSLRGDGKGRGPLADLIGIGEKMASNDGPDIKAALDQLSTALRLSSDNGAATKQNIQAIANSLADLTKSAADNDRAIRDFGADIHTVSEIVADENFGTGYTGKQINRIIEQATTLLERNRDSLKGTVANFNQTLTKVNEQQRDLAEIIDITPLLATNLYNAVDANARALRLHVLLDKSFVDSQMAKEVCNLAGIKDLGCNTGTYLDHTPGFGVKFFTEGMTGMLENMARGR
jgi:phospholipid/cholesterol/gamma-HCH transport system substrate-binding protein